MLGSLVSKLVRYSSHLMSCSCLLMKTQPRNLSMGYNRPKLLDPLAMGWGQHNSSKALVVRGVGMAAAHSLWRKIWDGLMGWERSLDDPEMVLVWGILQVEWVQSWRAPQRLNDYQK